MQKIDAKEAQNRFGAMLNQALVEPLVIQKHGQPVAVVMAMQRYQEMEEAAEDSFWYQRAKMVENQQDWIGVEASESFTDAIIHAEA